MEKNFKKNQSGLLVRFKARSTRVSRTERRRNPISSINHNPSMTATTRQLRMLNLTGLGSGRKKHKETSFILQTIFIFTYMTSYPVFSHKSVMITRCDMKNLAIPWKLEDTMRSNIPCNHEINLPCFINLLYADMDKT